MMPLTKYFCRNGYTHMMGSTAMIIAAICTEVAVTVECWEACIIAWREVVSTWFWMITSRIR